MLLLMCGLALTCQAEGETWKLEKSEDGIKVYTARVEGSEFKAFKAYMDVNAGMDQLVSMHLDPEDIQDWLYDCKKAKLVKKVMDNEYYIYYVSDAPWPVKDRDYVLHSIIRQNPEDFSVTIAFESVSGLMDQKEECVRMAQVKGYWLFRPIANQKIRIEYQVHADPNGSLPAWLANAAVVDQPFNTMKSIRDKLGQSKYKKASVAFICEPDECAASLGNE